MALDFPASPTPGQVYEDFYWDASAGIWRRQLNVTLLDDIDDVDAPSPSNGQYLAYNGSTENWEPLTPPEFPSPIGLILALGGE